jgi:hypothetical protein
VLIPFGPRLILRRGGQEGGAQGASIDAWAGMEESTTHGRDWNSTSTGVYGTPVAATLTVLREAPRRPGLGDAAVGLYLGASPGERGEKRQGPTRAGSAIPEIHTGRRKSRNNPGKKGELVTWGPHASNSTASARG